MRSSRRLSPIVAVTTVLLSAHGSYRQATLLDIWFIGVNVRLPSQKRLPPRVGVGCGG